jgi:hypothetical protein
VWLIEELTGSLVELEQLLYLRPQLGVVRAGPIKKSSALGRVLDVEGLKEKVTFGFSGRCPPNRKPESREDVATAGGTSGERPRFAS